MTFDEMFDELEAQLFHAPEGVFAVQNFNKEFMEPCATVVIGDEDFEADLVPTKAGVSVVGIGPSLAHFDTVRAALEYLEAV